MEGEGVERTEFLTSHDSFVRPAHEALDGKIVALGESFVVGSGITIGRAPGIEVHIEDTYASGHHARIYDRAGLVYVEDMNSTNGTFLNGRRLDGEAELNDLDEVRIGDTEFRFELEGPGVE